MVALSFVALVCSNQGKKRLEERLLGAISASIWFLGCSNYFISHSVIQAVSTRGTRGKGVLSFRIIQRRVLGVTWMKPRMSSPIPFKSHAAAGEFRFIAVGTYSSASLSKVCHVSLFISRRLTWHMAMLLNIFTLNMHVCINHPLSTWMNYFSDLETCTSPAHSCML